MKRRGIIIISSLLVFVFGCEKIHCPEFPNQLNYFPYSQGQILKFVNLHNDIQNFTITYRENSKSTSYEWNCKCECAIYSMFCAKSNTDLLDIQCDILVSGQKYGSNISITFKAGQDYLYEEIMQDKHFSYNKIGNFISDTIFLKNPNNKRIKKVVIVKDKGLLSYTTADGEEWNLVE